MCSENYKIISTDGMVQAFSKERIPYQPQDWRKEFRNALRCALSKLKITSEGQYLMACYYGTGAGSFDLENVLFYNIGSAPFRPFAANRIFAENCSHQETKTTNEGAEFPHRYVYKICDSETCRDFWINRTLAAEWESLSVPVFLSSNKAVDYWRALRENPGKVHSYHKLQGSNFGVKIKLSVPKTKTVNLTSVVKPMLDGVICAFHSADQCLQKESSLIASRLGVPKQQLLSTDNDILGPNRFIYPYRKNSVKWNPRDNHCLAFEIEAEHNNDGGCRFSGKIFE